MFLPTKDFNLAATLESGQVFGFRKVGGYFEGAIGGASVRLAKQNGFLEVEGKIKTQDVAEYFDLDFNLAPIYAHLSMDEWLWPVLNKFKGLRLIHQDPWEALACFIISSNNNVKRIQGIWRNLSKYFAMRTVSTNKTVNRGSSGRLSQRASNRCITHHPVIFEASERRRTEHAAMDSDFGFPGPEQIAGSHERILRQLGLGYRAPFLLRTAQFVSVNPGCLSDIEEASYEEAKERVLAFPGIGPKVADCVLLYGFHKLEAFPVDVWISRVMRKLYFRNRKVSEDKIRAFAKRRWGQYAGYVQQYLFHGARTGVL